MFGLKSFLTRIMSIGDVQRQSIISFFWQLAFTFLGLFSTMYFSHVVGAEILGAYFLFLAYLGIIGMITDGGFGQAAIKRISEGEEQDAYFSAFLVLRSLFVTITVITLILLRNYFVDLNRTGTFIWLLLALIISIFYGSISYGIAGRGKMGVFSTGGFINDSSRILIQVIAIFLGFGVAGLAGGFVLGMLVAGIIELRFFDLRLMRFGWRHVKSLSAFSFWLFMTSGGVLVFSYADTVMIGYFMENADVGVYKVVIQITTAATFTTHAMLQTLWPKVSRWGKTGETGLIEKSLSRAFSYSFLLAVPVSFGGILLGDKLLYFLFGAEFERGYQALIIWSFVHIVNIFQFFFTSYLSALNRQKESFKATAIAALLNIILNLMLIPFIGIVGAAIASLAAMALNAMLAGRILLKIIDFRFERDSLGNIFKASIAMSLLVIGYRHYIPLSSVWITLAAVILGGAFYGILILKFDRNIYEELKGIVAQINGN